MRSSEYKGEGTCPNLDGAEADACDLCDTNICNGWTLRALPDSELMSDGAAFHIVSLKLSTVLL